MIDKILEHNKTFVRNKEYEAYATDKFPAKKIAIVTCMDTRLVTLLPAALGISNGDVKIIKNAGGVVPDHFDSTMRSLLVAIYELGVNHIMVIGHTGCGVQGMKGEHMLTLMRRRGISDKDIELLRNRRPDLERWLDGFEETPCAVMDSVKMIRQHPLIPADVTVSGYMIDSETGKLSPLE